jgi:hypothetical protein
MITGLAALVDPRPRLGRLRGRATLALRLAVVGWQVGRARERLADRYVHAVARGRGRRP